MSNIETILSARLSMAICAALGEELAGIDPLLSSTASPKFGDFQANLAMGLARRLGKQPRDIAAEIAAWLDDERLFERVEVAGPGFINLYLNRDFINRCLIDMATDTALGIKQVATPETIIVDYSAPNVAKEMHVGHLRSTLIGDTIVRILSMLGHKVIRQNHLGDWGTQFGMLIEHMIESGWDPAERAQASGDLHLLYQAAKQKFDSDGDFAGRARARVVALQAGDEQSRGYWQSLIDDSRRHFNSIYQRLGVLLEDGDICAESFYNPVLAETITELDAAGVLEHSDGAAVVFPEGFTDRDGKPLPLIVQKQDGGYLYATTDLAAARYRIRELGADRIIYVIDARQSLHLSMLFATLEKAGWLAGGVRLQHVAFGTVLGADRRPFKTRTGETVRLAALLDEAVVRTGRVIDAKQPALSAQQRQEIARIVGIGALKYADLSNDRIKDYIFDWDRMLALDGNTAPYLQNAYVRIRAIFRKGEVHSEAVDMQAISIAHPAERTLALKLLRFAPTLELAAAQLEPSRLCTYLYELATGFHAFYENCPVVKDDVSDTVRAGRLALCALTARVLKQGLALLGIETVEQM